MPHVEVEVGDWVRYENDDGEEVVQPVIRISGTGIFTPETGKYWLTVGDILEVRKKGTP